MKKKILKLPKKEKKIETLAVKTVYGGCPDYKAERPNPHPHTQKLKPHTVQNHA